jgi:hypothetical protein
MKIALVTTTVNVPRVINLYRAQSPSDNGRGVRFFVAGDRKTVSRAEQFCADVDDCCYLSPQAQAKWKSSEFIGWDNDSRRNFAILAALEWGADILITIDDDMIPTPTFFDDFAGLFVGNWSGLSLGVDGLWFDHGRYTVPKYRARGLPPDRPIVDDIANFVFDVTIGLAQGTILGVPDTDGMTSCTQQTHVTGISEILRNGFVVNPKSYAVLNSQVTAFRRELAPAAVQFYFEQGRNTDIFASLIMRRAAAVLGWVTHYGLPSAYHARSERSRFRDLQAEMWGLQRIGQFNDELWSCGPFASDESVSGIIKKLACGNSVLSVKNREAFAAWLEDCGEAMNGYG